VQVFAVVAVVVELPGVHGRSLRRLSRER
jgi:hypothetical protein